jgi:hypothetical protein
VWVRNSRMPWPNMIASYRPEEAIQIDRYVPYLHVWHGGQCLNLVDMMQWESEWASYPYSLLAVRTEPLGP